MFENAFFDINIHYLIAGFAGGIVHAILVRKAGPWEIIGYIVVGGLAANFFTPQVLRLLNQFPEGLIAFMVGMGGFRICRQADKFFAGTWKPFERTKNE
jgi:hypothetical protein